VCSKRGQRRCYTIIDCLSLRRLHITIYYLCHTGKCRHYNCWYNNLFGGLCWKSNVEYLVRYQPLLRFVEKPLKLLSFSREEILSKSIPHYRENRLIHTELFSWLSDKIMSLLQTPVWFYKYATTTHGKDSFVYQNMNSLEYSFSNVNSKTCMEKLLC